MLSAALALTLLALVFGLLLGYSSIRFKVEGDPVVDQIDGLLPQTQCGQCGYPGCRPYAEAIASGEAEINRCPPGGEAVIQQLADLLGREDDGPGPVFSRFEQLARGGPFQVEVNPKMDSPISPNFSSSLLLLIASSIPSRSATTSTPCL